MMRLVRNTWWGVICRRLDYVGLLALPCGLHFIITFLKRSQLSLSSGLLVELNIESILIYYSIVLSFILDIFFHF